MSVSTPLTFNGLTLEQALKKHFGFDAFRPGQREVIEHLLAGRSAAAVFPTGSGKSLCYQLTALALPGVTLVVSPLIALMKDQIDALARRGIAAKRLDSTLSLDEYQQVMQQVREGTLRLLYVAPERFNNERFRETILQTRISLFAIDEAHCISEWGHNFRPDYLKLASFAKHCKAERILGLTATATPKVLSDMCRVFDIDSQAAICTGFYRPNLRLLTTPVREQQRDEVLVAKLNEHPRGPTIVYVTLQRTAETVAELLKKQGFPAKAYHAGMKDPLRAQVQEWFLDSTDGVVVATIAFGMGVDKSNIRYVYHYNLPKSLENYSQEIGRAGRDGELSLCQMLVCSDDLTVLENFIYGDTPTRHSVRRLIQEVFSLGEHFDVSYYELSRLTDIRILVLRTLLTYLELDGYLQGGTPFYEEYQFKPLMPSKQMLEKFDDQRRKFLIAMFAQARRASIWFSINLHDAAQKLGQPRERFVRALDYLAEQQMIELKVQGVRNRYHRLKTPDDLDALADALHAKMIAREESEAERLKQVVAITSGDECQVAALCSYFGEPLPQACGHCSHCLEGATSILDRQNPPIDETRLDQAIVLRDDHAELRDPVVFTRFLCGLTSPQLTRSKLSGHRLFGCCAEVPFQQVLLRVR